MVSWDGVQYIPTGFVSESGNDLTTWPNTGPIPSCSNPSRSDFADIYYCDHAGTADEQNIELIIRGFANQWSRFSLWINMMWFSHIGVTEDYSSRRHGKWTYHTCRRVTRSPLDRIFPVRQYAGILPHWCYRWPLFQPPRNPQTYSPALRYLSMFWERW